ncbi:hypothetical protein QQP08_023767 [Theobroma cacao]|nr:hypothetical protein QQP08_023767 [Theobroma cacao]
MAGVGFAGVGLAEAYVMRSLHKEKMKKMEKEEAKTDRILDEEKIPGGCFFWVSKKSHSAKVASADSTEKPTQNQI